MLQNFASLKYIYFILGLASFDKVLKTYFLAKHHLGEILSSCEMMDRLSIDVSINNLGMKNPLTSREDGHEFYMIIETSGSYLVHDEEKLSSFVEKAINDDLIEDGTMTSESKKFDVCDRKFIYIISIIFISQVEYKNYSNKDIIMILFIPYKFIYKFI